MWVMLDHTWAQFVCLPTPGLYTGLCPDKQERGSLNSLDLRNGGVALYLENFNRLELLRSVP